MDLSKAYDCLPHDLLIAKLVAYGFSINSLCLMYDYLNNRYQRVKIGSIRSSPCKIHMGGSTRVSIRIHAIQHLFK